MKVRTLIEEMKKEMETVDPSRAPKNPKTDMRRSLYQQTPTTLATQPKPENRLKMERLETIRKKVEKKLGKIKRMGRQYEALLEERKDSEPQLVEALFSEVNGRLFAGQGLRDKELISAELEKVDIDALNVEVFVRDLLGAPRLDPFMAKIKSHII